MKRITPVFVTLALALVVWSCGGNSTLDNSEAPVYLTVDVSNYTPDIDICLQSTDIAITSMEITSETRNPDGSGRQSQTLGDHAVPDRRRQHGFARVDI